MKVALVHDYLSQDGGAERVLKAFHEIWPEAPIFVLFHNKKTVPYFKEAEIRESFLAKMPFARNKFQWYLPLMPFATERHNLHDFDVVLSSTSAFAKGIITRPETMHISYCHTPTRYLWTDTHQYISDLKYNRLVKAALPPIIYRLRLWDKMSVDRVDHFFANSRTVQQRINKYYRRESTVLYPPVDLPEWEPNAPVGDYFISGGRIVPYKRFDLLVATFNRLKTPLKIFGDGPALTELKSWAKPNIEFLGRISDDEKHRLMRGAKAFLHPQVEDLGITPIESMAQGRPVIAYGVGGATETIIPGETGQFFYEQSWESLLDALVHFDHEAWDQELIRSRAEQFGVDLFKIRVEREVKDRYEEFQRGLNQCQLDLLAI